MSNFKTKFCWWPVRLARHTGEEMEFIGWVWLQEANLTNNLNHGWVAFLDAKPWPKKCKTCGQELPANDLGNRRAAFGASVLTDGLAGKRTE